MPCQVLTPRTFCSRFSNTSRSLTCVIDGSNQQSRGKLGIADYLPPLLHSICTSLSRMWRTELAIVMVLCSRYGQQTNVRSPDDFNGCTFSRTATTQTLPPPIPCVNVQLPGAVSQIAPPAGMAFRVHIRLPT